MTQLQIMKYGELHHENNDFKQTTGVVCKLFSTKVLWNVWQIWKKNKKKWGDTKKMKKKNTENYTFLPGILKKLSYDDKDKPQWNFHIHLISNKYISLHM